jgi:Resolvase, N terminal domain
MACARRACPRDNKLATPASVCALRPSRATFASGKGGREFRPHPGAASPEQLPAIAVAVAAGLRRRAVGRHRGSLARLRAEEVDAIYREKASGKSVKNRPELEKAIDQLGTGDILVVAEWDRATRSMFDGIDIIKRIHDRGALIKVLDKPHLDLTTPLGRGFIAFLSAMAEDERHRILKRANEGRAAAKAKGTRFGRKPKLTGHQQAEPSSAWPRVKAAGRSPRRWPCTTLRSRGWRARSCAGARSAARRCLRLARAR